MTNSSGALLDMTRFLPFGGFRGSDPAFLTERAFTGHKANNTSSNDLGLIYMNARYYVGSIGRFASADTLVPDPTNPQQFNRYTYSLNNPVRYSDPTGHCAQYLDGNGMATDDYMECLTAWFWLHDYFESAIRGCEACAFPTDFMQGLLENASTGEITDMLDGFGGDYDLYTTPWGGTLRDTSPQSTSIVETSGNASYVAGSLSGGVGINGKVTIIIDRYGNVYLYFGGEVGFRGVSGSLTTGWVNEGAAIQDLEVIVVDEEQLESLLTGLSVSAGGGALFGGSIVGPFGRQNNGYLLTEAGLFFPPQAGAGGGYSFMLHNANEPTLWNSRLDYWYWYHYGR